MIIGSMCTGYGGMDEGVLSVLDGEIAWVADNDSGAARVLADHYPNTPNLGDIRAMSWADSTPVDLLLAGFPCQPVSLAGRKKGVEDDRWLFDDIMAAVDHMEEKPRVILLENVKGLLTAGERQVMARVIGSLASRGYVGSYRNVRASEAGAPHRRERIFILAYLPPAPPWLQAFSDAKYNGLNDSEGGQADTRASFSLICDKGWEEYSFWGQKSSGDSGLRDSIYGSADWGVFTAAVRRWEKITGRAVPFPGEKGERVDRAAGWILSPIFDEWLMGLPLGWVTHTQDLTRSQQIKLLGNGCVPQQAALAFCLLCRSVCRKE